MTISRIVVIKGPQAKVGSNFTNFAKIGNNVANAFPMINPSQRVIDETMMAFHKSLFVIWSNSTK